jgi:putative NIF3 family GTP cyclohydrolase 1 type 2
MRLVFQVIFVFFLFNVQAYSMNLSAVVSVLKNFAPLSLAEKWDNVGLLVEPSTGGSTPIERILLTNDLTEDVLEEALQKKSQLILSYHPPIFAPMKALTTANAKQRIIVKAIENRIAIYSPHTAFDSVKGGVNDWIADAVLSLGQGTSTPLQPHESITNTHKIVIFVPEDKADEMREELSKVGAGVIGNYNKCSFGLVGEGTFFGNDNANPGRREGEGGGVKEAGRVTWNGWPGRGPCRTAWT